MAQINKPSEYFNTKLYTGTGSELAVTGVGFQPDWIWFKQRDATRSHALVDSVRGRSKVVFSDLTNAEETSAASTNDLVSFDSDGFTVGTTSASGSFNTSSGSHVAWNWKANGAGVSNTDGSITSTVSANTTSGFSIVSYTGTGANATVGHGLGAEAKFIIFKDRSTTKDWFVYHQSISPATGGKLNLTVNPSADSSYFNNTAPTSSVFSIGGANTTNPSGNNMIAYCFAEKKGFSKFGSYTGNGNADGTFVYTGFKPAFVLIKANSAGQDWHIHDIKRSTFNVSDTVLLPNTIDADITDTTVYGIDILSNGFKCRGTHPRVNGSGTGYIYMAFAENPFVTSTGIPTTAR